MTNGEFRTMLVMIMVFCFGGMLAGMGMLYGSDTGLRFGIAIAATGAASLFIFAVVKLCRTK